MRRLRSRLASLLLRAAERLEPRYSFRWLSSVTYTYERGEGMRFRHDGRGRSLWVLESDERKAWDEADTAWAAAGMPDALSWHRDRGAT